LKVSRKTEYAVRALIHLADRASENVLWQQIGHIAQATGIPEKFLEQILLIMKNGGLLVSRRGIEGGYSLNRPADSIPVDEVVHLLEGPAFLEPSSRDTIDPETAVFRHLVRSAEEDARTRLRGKTIEDLRKEAAKLRSSKVSPLEYQI
jgi:Rrf2 family protein